MVDRAPTKAELETILAGAEIDGVRVSPLEVRGGLQ